VRKLLILLLGLSILISPTAFAETAVIDEQINISSLTREAKFSENSSKVGVWFAEDWANLHTPTFLYGWNAHPSKGIDAVSFCTGLNDPNCKSAKNMRYHASYLPCQSKTDVDCIESIYAIDPETKNRVEGIVEETIPKVIAKPYKADIEQGLPPGGNPSVWKIPNVIHKGGKETYAVILTRLGTLTRSGNKFIVNETDPWTDGDFRASIYPVNVISDPKYSPHLPKKMKLPAGNSHVVLDSPGGIDSGNCALVGEGTCALRQAFPLDVEFGMSMRFSKVMTGWLHGRIDNPDIKYKLTDYGVHIDIKGLATRVPLSGGLTEKSEFSDAQLKKYSEYLSPGFIPHAGSSGEFAMEFLGIWSKATGDKSMAYPSQWDFYNLNKRFLRSSTSCIKNAKTLAGFVTTNSTTYSASPPVLNSKTQTLDYRVASPHYLADGTVFAGKYDLFISSKVARCIYGFTNAPISASISVIGENGETKVATTTMRENAGWIHLSARGFTFSNPVIKVKLKQKK
jgi:hypothetical protein